MILRSLYLVVMVTVLITSAELAAPTVKRNVLLIFGDDAGFQMGAYNNTDIMTPNWDALAGRSVVFRHGFTSVSSCSPSRSVLLTGQPQHQNGHYGLAQEPHHFSSFDSVQSLPVILSQNGVRTGIVGKKHVKPDSVYKFEFDASDEVYDLQQIGRNITFMKEKVQAFLSSNDSRPFFLYVAFHDPHRNPDLASTFGQFMERWGDGQTGHGLIPDWTPVQYYPEKVKVPYFLPDTNVTRQELANMYTTYSRMDQGIGLFMKELESAGFLNNTLVLYTSDNGIPYPNAKTNLYESGMGEPMMISNPFQQQHWGEYTDALASTMDFTPTILDWFGVNASAIKGRLSGKSLLPLTEEPDNITNYQTVFSSHNFHEVTMYYPMRVIRTPRYRLIHNINHRAPFGLATDLYQAPTFQQILNDTQEGRSSGWFKSLNSYYYRDQYELFDLQNDPEELQNVADDPSYQQVLQDLSSQLLTWQKATNDTWRCMPSAILEGSTCDAAYNGE